MIYYINAKKAAHSKFKRNNQYTAFKPYNNICLLINHVKQRSKSCLNKKQVNSRIEHNLLPLLNASLLFVLVGRNKYIIII